jgi:hypothetical protein
MKTTLEDFWIRCYLGSREHSDYIDLSINRAYRDLNRTIHGMKNINPDLSKKNYAQLSQTVNKSVNILLDSKIKNQEEYDKIHEKECNILIQKFKQLYDDGQDLKFHIGQAQKWINMTLKYLYAIGKERHQLSLDNYYLFHIPIDNIIQEKLKEKGILPLKANWSRLDSYKVYIEYQNHVRTVFNGRIPMDVEFELFNN